MKLSMHHGDRTAEVSVRTNAGQVLAMLREDRAARKAIKRMPRPVPWEWAKSRLVPLLAGPRIDPAGESLVRSVMPPGVAVTFAIDLQAAFPHVDETVARRWECTPEQIQDVALGNLERRAASLQANVVRTATFSGHLVRLLDREPAWASSLVLVPDELRRLFGSANQIFTAPRQDVLLSFAPTTPTHVVAEVTVDMEAGGWPLWLDPFSLSDGELFWGGADEYEEDELAG